jgi:hypothetical protein
MRIVTGRAATERARFLRLRVLGIAALALILTGAGVAGNAAAGSFLHDAARGTEVHQAESPNLATPASETLLSGCVIGSWIHSWEEDTAETIVFRPADYPFGPSRGRDGYEFQTGGILVYHGFGPADEPLTSTGEWGWHSGDQIHLVVNDPQGAYIDETLRIVSCDAEVLQVERIAEAAE